jgi:hypothetical protein
MTKTLVEAGNLVGLNVHPRGRGDFFFLHSDNAALATAGTPAHAFGVGLLFADHHKVEDEWQKFDYENMAKCDRAVALGLWLLASEVRPPGMERVESGNGGLRRGRAALARQVRLTSTRRRHATKAFL